MPRPKGRASRDESGTWRRGSGDDEKEESTAYEEDSVPVKPRAPSVSRSVRSRRSKADLSAVTEEPQSPTAGRRPKSTFRGAQTMGLPTAHLLSIVAALTAFLCLIGVIGYSASLMPTQPPGLSSDSEGAFSKGRLFDWINYNIPRRQSLSDTDKAVKAGEDTAQPLAFEEDVGSLQKDPAFACPQCPICAELATETDETTIRPAGKIQDPFPPILDLYISQYPTISNFIRRWTASYYELLNAHPWIFLALALCGSWKIIEVLWIVGKKTALRMEPLINNFAESWREKERVEKKKVEEGERKRREAEQKLLQRMMGKEKEKEEVTTTGEGEKKDQVKVE